MSLCFRKSIKSSMWLKSVILWDGIWWILFLFVIIHFSCCYHQEYVQTQISVWENDKLVSQSCSQNCLLCLVRATCTSKKKWGNMSEHLRCFSLLCPTILLKTWHHCSTCTCSLLVCNDTLFKRWGSFIPLAQKNLESPDSEILYFPHLVDGFGKYVLIPQAKVFNCHCKDYFCVSKAGYFKSCV